MVNVPIVHFSVEWWNTLHQGATIKLMGQSSIDSRMVLPLVLVAIGTKLWFLGSLLVRTQTAMLEMESGKDWVKQIARGAHA